MDGQTDERRRRTDLGVVIFRNVKTEIVIRGQITEKLRPHL